MRDLHNLLAVVLLAAAAWRDVAVRIIPDLVCAGLLMLAVSARGRLGPTCLLNSLAVALALFLSLVPLHAHGLLGGGDVKLAAAFAAGLAPVDTYRFVIVTALAGGALALGYLALARLPQPSPPTGRVRSRPRPGRRAPSDSSPGPAAIRRRDRVRRRLRAPGPLGPGSRLMRTMPRRAGSREDLDPPYLSAGNHDPCCSGCS
jgi:prepilin peptidase CpaA